MSSGGGSRVSNGSGGAARTSVNRDFNTASLSNSHTVTTTNRDLDLSPNAAVGYDSDGNWHLAVRGGAWGIATGVTTVAVGTAVFSLPTPGTTFLDGDITYQQCGSSWYQPQFDGPSVTYAVLAPPH